MVQGVPGGEAAVGVQREEGGEQVCFFEFFLKEVGKSQEERGEAPPARRASLRTPPQKKLQRHETKRKTNNTHRAPRVGRRGAAARGPGRAGR